MAASNDPDSSSHSGKSRLGRTHLKKDRVGRSRSTGRRWLIGFGVVVAGLLLVQLIASPIATWLVNRKLAAVPGYSGTVDGVSIALWKAGIDVRDFTLFEGEHATDRPLLRIEQASIKLAPGALFAGKLGGSALVDGVELIVIKREDAPEEPSEDIGKKMQEVKEKIQRWQDVLRDSFPVKLTRLEVKNARFQFVDRTEKPLWILVFMTCISWRPTCRIVRRRTMIHYRPAWR